MLVPLDGSATSEEALPYVRAIAAPDAEIILMHAAPTPGVPIMPRREASGRRGPAGRDAAADVAGSDGGAAAARRS